MSAHTSGDAAPDLAIDLGQLHELLLESEDISAFLTDFTAVMSRRLSAGGNEIWCAVNLLRQRKAATVASSDPRAKDLDETQNRFLDGPCLTAMREQRLIRADDMSTDTRWPGYAAAAVEQGIGSILGIPFDLGD
ncbi:GAF domain-containing protein [Arthrobacter subterraneus]|uniref:GAF domain-containing protein n=1 Tax=Arthrobacter subterraneus TaxID=335973 RepID=UPI00380E157D